MSRGSSQGYRLTDLENVLSERGWSQADLSRRSGLSAPTVGRAAAGREEVSAESAKKIAGALRVQVGTLCRGSRQRRNTGTNAVADGATEYLDFDPRRMRQAMAERGMSPTEIAARAELSLATVSSALRGVRSPQKDTIARIAAAFGKAPTELYSEASYPESSSVQYRSQTQAGELRLVAGQSRTTSYPQVDAGEKEIQKPDQPVVTTRVTGSEIEGQRATGDTLEGLLSRLGQARQMVGSLMEHIGNLEAQVSRYIHSEEEPGRGANAGSKSQ